MNAVLIENLAILACSTLGFLSGIRYLNTRKAIFAGMIVQGVLKA